jgi:phytoene dehydrogenase-like protein
MLFSSSLKDPIRQNFCSFLLKIFSGKIFCIHNIHSEHCQILKGKIFDNLLPDRLARIIMVDGVIGGMMGKSIIIIGAGMAGLSAGCYAEMNGYDAEIFELHSKPGGLCTSWKRKDYIVDGCLHWLVGSSPSNSFYQVWRELGALQGRKVIDHEIFTQVIDPSGKKLILYTNVDKLEKHLLELSPADEKVIKDLTKAVRKFTTFNPSIESSMGNGLKMLIESAPYLWPFIKWSRLSVQDWAARFQDPFLRRAFGSLFNLPGFSMIFMIITLGWMNAGAAGYPIGGSLEFSRAIEKRFLDLGGKLHYKSRVEKILAENNRAVGIRLQDGAEKKADYVVSAADGHATIYDMLEGKYINDEIKKRYAEMPRFKSMVQVALGVNRDMSQAPELASYLLEKPVRIAGEDQNDFAIHNYSYDPTLAPPGKTVLVVRFMSDINNWRELAKDQEKYSAEKQKITDTIMGLVEAKYPGISEQVEMVDVATPMTFERYTGNWEGSIEGWLMTTKNAMSHMKRTLPGLDNFYMIGQWLQPGGGVPTGAIMGREIVNTICKKDKQKFRVSTP